MPFKGQIFYIFNEVAGTTTTSTTTSTTTIGIVTTNLILNLDASNTSSYPGSGTTWTDLSGNSNNGTLLPAGSPPVFNNANGGAIQFDGIEDYVNVGSSTAFQLNKATGYTIALWVLTPASFTSTVIAAWRGVTTPFTYWGWAVLLTPSGFGPPNVTNGVVFSTNGNNTFGGISNLVTPNTWMYITVVVSGNAAGNATIYTNGVNRGTLTPNFNDGATNADLGVTQEVYLARKVSFYEWWQQRQAEVQIYNRALNITEIQQNYNFDKDKYTTWFVNSISTSVSATANTEYGFTTTQLNALGALSGDLCIVQILTGEVSTADSTTATGLSGQSGSLLYNDNMSAGVGFSNNPIRSSLTNVSLNSESYRFVFNGTWSSNMTFRFTGTTGRAYSITMMIFRSVNPNKPGGNFNWTATNKHSAVADATSTLSMSSFTPSETGNVICISIAGKSNATAGTTITEATNTGAWTLVNTITQDATSDFLRARIYYKILPAATTVSGLSFNSNNNGLIVGGYALGSTY